MCNRPREPALLVHRDPHQTVGGIFMSGIKNSKRQTILLAAVLVVLIAVFALVYLQNTEKTMGGGKSITLIVVHGDASEKQFTIKTDAQFLRGALEEVKLIQGKEGQMGLYIQTVDGETADEAKQQWWCVTKGGEDVNTGVDTTPIESGDAYELTLRTGW